MQPAASALVLDEYFETGDERFFETLLDSYAEKKLAAFAKRFFEDRRPWAREMLLRYIDDGCDRNEQRGLVKRLFKLAEEAEDDELMAHFIVAFDRLVTQEVVKLRSYDWRAREWVVGFGLRRMDSYPYDLLGAQESPRFSWVTRRYLQRRALRYLLRLHRREPQRFQRVLFDTLALYDDMHLERPGQLINAWSLVHLLYRGSGLLHWRSRSIGLKGGHKLEELRPAPLFPEVYEGALDELLELALRSRALVVRRFAIDRLRESNAAALAGLDITRLEPLLRSPHPELQIFAAELLQTATGLERLSVEKWLELVDTDLDAQALPFFCEQMERCVSPSRLSLEQCVALARARPAPVARLGLEWAQTKRIDGEAELKTALLITEARCPAIREPAAAWLAEQVDRLGSPEQLRDVIDARHREFREAALPLLAEQERFRDATLLWAALAESPYAEVRAFLISHLEARASLLDPESVVHVWHATLVDVRRGSRAKRRALKQLAERIIAEPQRAEELLPLLALALRSVRGAEVRAALGAIGRAAYEEPTLREAIERHIPELELFPPRVGAGEVRP